MCYFIKFFYLKNSSSVVVTFSNVDILPTFGGRTRSYIDIYSLLLKPEDMVISTNFTLLWSQGILKGKVSMYCWPAALLVWNQLFDNWQFMFSFSKQTNPNQSNRRSTVQWYFPLWYSLVKRSSAQKVLKYTPKRFFRIVPFSTILLSTCLVNCLRRNSIIFTFT